MLVRRKHHAALHTLFMCMNYTIGALEILERFDDELAEKEEKHVY